MRAHRSSSDRFVTSGGDRFVDSFSDGLITGSRDFVGRTDSVFNSSGDCGLEHPDLRTSNSSDWAEGGSGGGGGQGLVLSGGGLVDCGSPGGGVPDSRGPGGSPDGRQLDVRPSSKRGIVGGGSGSYGLVRLVSGH